MSRALVGIALGFALAAAVSAFFPHALPAATLVAKAATAPERPESAFRCRGAVTLCVTFASTGAAGR